MHPLKQAGIFLSLLIFLGGVQVSAYSESPESRAAYHAQNEQQSVAAPEEIFLESGEERDIEAQSRVCVLSDDFHLPQANLVLLYYPFEKFTPSSEGVFSQQHSRAPPAL